MMNGEEGTFERISAKIGRLVDVKNAEYGNSFSESGKVLELLYPNGIVLKDYTTILAIIRIIDKLFRIATNPKAFGEDPWMDIAGYAILMVKEGERNE